jgi:hypothetical protein
MALSGSFYTNVGSHWRLQAEWSATQNYSANTSTITVKLYWWGLDKYGAVNSSASKTSGLNHDTGSWVTYTASGLADLSANQKKLIQTYSFTLTHDVNGNKTFKLDGYFGAEVTLSGTYYGTISLTETSFTLNQIPRQSTLKSSASFTAGTDMTVSINTASTSFTNTVKLQVKKTDNTTWQDIKTWTFGAGVTSVSSGFTDADKLLIFQTLAGRTSAPTQMITTTTNNGLTDTDTGTVTIPSLSKITSFGGTFDTVDSHVSITQAVNMTVSRSNSGFTHTLTLTVGTFTKTFSSVATSQSFTLTSTEQNSIYSQIPNTTLIDGNVKVQTYFQGQIVGTYTDNDIDFYVPTTPPTFSSSSITYTDTNTTANTVKGTGNESLIIQNVSDLQVSVTTSATPINYATISRYDIEVNGATGSLTAIGNKAMGKVSAGVNVTLNITAVDSRGFKTKVTKTVTVIPYQFPIIVSSAKRQSGFLSDTTITLSGSLSKIVIGGVDKNKITDTHYRTQVSGGSWSATTPFVTTYNTDGTYLSKADTAGNDAVVTLDNASTWTVEVTVVDVFGTSGTSTTTMVVNAGKPIFFIDSTMKSIGFGDFPTQNNQFFMNGRLEFGSNQYVANGGGGIAMNNSDIVGVNGIYFNDIADLSNGEGLLFAKTGTTVGSSDKTAYDNFLVKDGIGYLGTSAIFQQSNPVLWSGGSYMNDAQTITLSKAVSTMPNGIILVWSDYGVATSTPNNYDWCYTYVPKAHVLDSTSNGNGVHCFVSSNTSNTYTYMATKYVYIFRYCNYWSCNE